MRNNIVRSYSVLFIFFLILGCITLLMFSFKGYYLGQKKNQPLLVSSPVSDKANGLSGQYKNEYYRIQFPSGYKIEELPKTPSNEQVLSKVKLTSKDDIIYITVGSNYQKLYFAQSLGYGPNLQYNSDLLRGKDIEQIAVDSTMGESVKELPIGQAGSISDFIVLKGSLIYQINLSPVKNSSYQLLKQIISTLQLKEQKVITPSPTLTPLPPIQVLKSDTSHIYKNNKLGFSFEFPSFLVLNSSSSETFISFLQKQNDLMAQRLLVEVRDNPQNDPPYEVLKKQNFISSSETNLIYEPTVINNHKALLVTKIESMKDACNYEDTTRFKRIKYALVNGEGFTLFFTPNDSCDTLKSDWFGRIPFSVQFSN